MAQPTRINLTQDQIRLLRELQNVTLSGKGTAASSLVRKGLAVRTADGMTVSEAGKTWWSNYKPRTPRQ